MSGVDETDVRRAVAAALGAIVSVRRPLPHQVPPSGDWYGWLLLAGRGAGKTEACARYVTEHVRGSACLNGPTPHWIGIIAPTLGDAVTACVNGPSGIKQYDPSVKLAQTSGGTVVRWGNGSEAKLFGAQGPEDIERLRAGGNRCVFWLEELAAWRYLDAAWDQMRFGLRVGPRPRWIASTTPKPRHLIKRLDRGEIPNVRRTHATMFDNPYLPQEIRDALLDAYGGKTLGQQELYAKIIEQDEDALWQRKWIDDNRVKTSEVPDLRRVTVGVDPSGGAGEQGIVVVGKSIEWTDVPAANGQVVRKSAAQGWTLADRTVRQSPAGWGKRAVEAAVEWDADDIVVETNFGGDMAVATVVGAAQALGVQIPVKKVRASRGKRPRAEPVAALAQRNEWHHVGVFEALEDQLCLVADTLVWTARGQVPIQDVSTQDLVMTRAGWAPVTWAGMTGITTELVTVHVQGDRILRCTPRHPVYRQESDEFVSAMSVRPGDHLAVRCRSERMVTQWLGVDAGGDVCLKVGIDTLRANFSTMRSGKRIEDPFRLNTSFITSTLIPTIIDSRTLSLLRMPSISSSTVVAQRCHGARSSVGRVAFLDHSNVVRSGHEGNLKSSPAQAVASSFNHEVHVPYTAPHAVLDVVTEIVHPTPVYNLSVQGQPEFFANDVLVHNCTWTLDTDYSPDRLDAMVWAGWHLRLAATLGLVTSQFPGSQLARTRIS